MANDNLKPEFEILLNEETGKFIARRSDHPELSYEHQDAVKALVGLVQKLNVLLEAMAVMKRAR